MPLHTTYDMVEIITPPSGYNNYKRKYRRDEYDLYCYRQDPHSDEHTSDKNQMEQESRLDGLSKEVRALEEEINAINRVMQSAAGHLTGTISTIKPRDVPRYKDRADRHDEDMVLQEKIIKLKARRSGWLDAVQMITPLLLTTGSIGPRVPPLEPLDDTVPDCFLRLTCKGKKSSFTFFDRRVGFACGAYKSARTSDLRPLLPIPPNSQISTRDPRCEMTQRIFNEHFDIKRHSPSPWISVTQNPYRLYNFYTRSRLEAPDEDLEIAIIDTRRLRKMGVQFDRTTHIGSYLLSSASFVTATQWLVEHWIPAEAIVDVYSVEDFMSEFSTFDPDYDKRDARKYLSVQCKYEGNKLVMKDTRDDDIVSAVAGLHI